MIYPPSPNPSTKTDRQLRLLKVLDQKPQIMLAELEKELAVSQRLIRSDVKALVTAGYSLCIKGQEVLWLRQTFALQENSFSIRSQINATAKMKIGQWAARLVEDGDTIFVDASTTVFQMASFILSRHDLVIITNGIDIGRRLAANPTNTVVLVAGIIKPDGSSVIGPIYEPVLRNRHIKTAFVSCKGFSMAAGLTETDKDEAAVKSQVLTMADTTVALVDSSKFGMVFDSPFARASQIVQIFSDTDLDPNWIEQVQKSAIVLTCCQ